MFKKYFLPEEKLVYTNSIEPNEILMTSLKNEVVVNLEGILVENIEGIISYSILESAIEKKDFKFPSRKEYFGRRIVLSKCKPEYFNEVTSSSTSVIM